MAKSTFLRGRRRKCIYKKLSDEEMECCPICNIDLGCVPLEKLRLDHNLQDHSQSINTEWNDWKKIKVYIRKASKGSSFTIEKPLKKDDDSMDVPESSSSPETQNKFTQNMRQSSAASEPSNHPNPDKRREDGSEAWEGKSKSSKFGFQGSAAKSEALHSRNNEGLLGKPKNREHRQKSKVQDEKNFSDHTPPESERPKKLRRIRQKKTRNFGEFRIPHREGDAPPLPQIAASYLRINASAFRASLILPDWKDGNIPVSFIQKYLKMKLGLTSEDEVEIKCMGQTVIPTLTLNNLVDLWLQTTTTERVSATIGSSAKDFVMVLSYARKVHDS
ncbi:hypothetical protein DH2020_024639 [Rehmannia glutinosa]|uniref:Uncharacterized protein n=1 Tax=Rehmannia glutinosa TaxID=99300 RepID=A0ABR0W6A7_REHGL